MDNFLPEETQLQRLFRQPNHGRRDDESDEAWMNRVRYAAMDIDTNNRNMEAELKATYPVQHAAQPGGALPIRRLPTAGSRVARMPSAGCR